MDEKDILIWDEEIRASENMGSYGGYLVMEHEEGKRAKKHLPTTMNGKLSRKLCAAAWASLFSEGGHRGQSYEGPSKSDAKRKLKAIYKKQGWPTPKSNKSTDVFDFDDTDDGTPITEMELAQLWGIPNCRAITDAPNLRERDRQCCGNCNVYKYLPQSNATAYVQDGKVDIYLPTRGVCKDYECEVDSNWVCDEWHKWQPEPEDEIVDVASKSLNIKSENVAKKLQPIKMIGETRAAGYGLYFSRSEKEKDVVGTRFTKATDIGEFYDHAPVLYHHGLVKAFGLDKIAKTAKAQIDDVGVWLEIELDRSKNYWKKVKSKIEQGIYYFSGGSAEHLIDTADNGELRAFPIFEWSITTTPAEWRLGAAQFYKSIGIDLDDNTDGHADGQGGEESRPETRKPETESQKQVKHLKGVFDMTPEELAALKAEMKSEALAAMKAENDRVAQEAELKKKEKETRDSEIKAEVDKQIAAFKASLPAIPEQRPGQYNINRRPLGDGFSFAKAIRGIALQYKNEPNPWSGAEKERDQMVRYSNEVRATLAEGVGNLGGYLVPPEYMQDQFIPLLRARSVLRSAGPRVIQTKSDTVYIPSQTGGATAAWYGENATLTASNLTVGQLAINVRKLGALEYISNELLADASPSADQLIREDLAAVVGITEDQTFFLSNGAAPSWANAPVGLAFYNGTTQVTIAADAGDGGAIAVADLFSFKRNMMQSNVPFDNLAWFMSPRTWDEVAQLKDSQNRYLLETLTGGNISQYPAYGNYPEGPETSTLGSVQGRLFGWPVYVTANITETNTKGNASTCSYLFFVRMPDLIIAERASLELMATNVAGTAFAADQTWIRAIMREGFGVRHAAGVVYADGLL